MNMIIGVAAVRLTAGKPLEADPIFHLIDVHRKARAAMNDVFSEYSRLEHEIPQDRRETHLDHIVETDDPRWLAIQRNLHATCKADDKAALDLIEDAPATVEGAIALLRYVADVELDGFEFPDGLITDEQQKIGKSWSFFLHKNLAETFASYAV